MKGISNTSFQKQINDEQCLQAQMILATMNVWFENYLLLWSDLKDIFLADLGWEQGPAWMGLTSLARDWASRALLPKLPGDRAKQLMQSDASEANFAFLGGFLRRHAQDLYNRDLNFREQVVVRRKEMEKRRKEAEKAKEPKEPQGPKRPRRR
jgi:hypothetical protein